MLWIWVLLTKQWGVTEELMEFIIHRTSQYTHSDSYRKVTGWDAWNLIKQQFFARKVSWNTEHISWKRLEMSLKHQQQGKDLHKLRSMQPSPYSGSLLKERWRSVLSTICNQGDVGEGSLIQWWAQSVMEELGPTLKRSHRTETPWSSLAASALKMPDSLGPCLQLSFKGCQTAKTKISWSGEGNRWPQWHHTNI